MGVRDAVFFLKNTQLKSLLLSVLDISCISRGLLSHFFIKHLWGLNSSIRRKLSPRILIQWSADIIIYSGRLWLLGAYFNVQRELTITLLFQWEMLHCPYFLSSDSNKRRHPLLSQFALFYITKGTTYISGITISLLVCGLTLTKCMNFISGSMIWESIPHNQKSPQ